MTSAPCACSASASARSSRTSPKPPGYCSSDRERAGARRVLRRPDDDGDPERRRPRADHVERLRKHVVRNEEAPALAPADAQRERHRLGGRRRLVEHRRIGDRHAREVADHRLEIDERLEAPLRDLRLVRRVRRVPRGILEDVAQDDARRVRAVVALPDVRREHAILRGDRPQARKRLRLGDGPRQRQRRALANPRGHDGVDQRGAGRIAQHREHRGLVGRRRADMARGEFRAVLESGEAGLRRCFGIHVRDSDLRRALGIRPRRSAFRTPRRRASPRARPDRRASGETAMRRRGPG